MKALILLLTVTQLYAGEVLRIRRDKVVFKLDESSQDIQRGEYLTVRRNGRDVGEIQFLLRRNSLGAARVVSGKVVKGDKIEVQSEIKESAQNDEFDFSDEMISDETSYSAAAVETRSTRRVREEESKSDEKNVSTAILGASGKMSGDIEATIQFPAPNPTVKFKISSDALNFAGARLGYKLNDSFSLQGELLQGSGSGQLCGSAGSTTACENLNIKTNSINLGLVYDLTQNIYLGINAGTIKTDMKSTEGADEINFKGGTIGLMAGLKFDLSDSIFLGFEGRYQSFNYNSSTFKLEGAAAIDSEDKLTQSAMLGLASIGIKF